MRFDPVGMLWEDKNKAGILPFWDTSWQPPELPNLRGAKVLGLDLETYDPAIAEQGPGWGYGTGHIVGVSLATEDASWYFPLRHTVEASKNMNVESTLRYLADVLAQPCPKVGANLQYDVGWLAHEGVCVNGPLYDVQFAEALIDDVARSYSLENISSKYLGTGKESSELYRWANKAYGEQKDQRSNIYRCPPSLVAKYAAADSMLPLQILKLQWKELSALGLVDLFKLECALIPILVKMRLRGMRVDIERAHAARDAINGKIQLLNKQLSAFAGFKISAYSNKDLERLFSSYRQPFPRTEAGNPSFTKEWLMQNDFEGAKLVASIRRYEKAVSTFIEGAILHKSQMDRIRPSLHPLRGESGGAVSGRFSSSQPNGQQLPSRDDELGPLIRGMFIPEEGHSWMKMDYSQIEYRMFAHFSHDKRLQEEYSKEGTDFHALVGSFMGGNIHRTAIKNINFGLLYGMGMAKLTRMLLSLNLDLKPEAFMKLYHDSFPAAKQQIRECLNTAEATGEIRTLLNRRNTFNLWEPTNREGEPLPYGQALRKYGAQIKRAMTYKALNRKLQGSAADYMKKALVDAIPIFEKIGYPHMLVHDELDISIHPDYEKEITELKKILENAVQLKVPMVVGSEIGPDWGHVK
jgi:DNA polymerase-1